MQRLSWILGTTVTVTMLSACSGSNFAGGSGKTSANTATDTKGNGDGGNTGGQNDGGNGNGTNGNGGTSGGPTGGTGPSGGTGTEPAGHTVYVPVGGSTLLPGGAGSGACAPADATVATCASGVVNGEKVGSTSIAGADGAPGTTVVVYDPNNPPPGVDTSGGSASGPAVVTDAGQLAALNAANIDPACTDTGGAKDNGSAFTFPVKVTLPNPLSNACQGGFEVNNTPGSFTLNATPQGGAKAVVLAVDFASYQQPNFFNIKASGPFGQDVVVLDTCELRTACYGDPSGGTTRPPEDSIRSFNVTLPAGVTSLTFALDDSSPFYVRVLGLCDFDLTNAKSKGAGGPRTLGAPTDSTPYKGAKTLTQGKPNADGKTLTCP